MFCNNKLRIILDNSLWNLLGINLDLFGHVCLLSRDLILVAE